MSDIDYDYPLKWLQRLGDPKDPWPDYLSQYGIVSSHIPGLLRMALTERYKYEEDVDKEDREIFPEDFANVHAWRALGQLRAVETAPQLINLFNGEIAEDDPWIRDDLPKVFGLFGLSVIPLVTELLKTPQYSPSARMAAIDCFNEIAKQHYVNAEFCIRPLVEVLSAYHQNEKWLNWKIVFTFSRLCIPSTYPLVQEVYQAGLLDAFSLGDWEDFQIKVGLLQKRLTKPSYSGYPLLMKHD